MTETAGLGLILFILGLFPLYFMYFNVEKHYVSFHSGFWNLYANGIAIIGAAVLFDNYLLFMLGIILMVFLFFTYEIQEDMRNRSYSNIVRFLGGSSIATSISWFVFIYGLTTSFFFGLFFGVLHWIALMVVNDDVWYEFRTMF